MIRLLSSFVFVAALFICALVASAVMAGGEMGIRDGAKAIGLAPGGIPASIIDGHISKNGSNFEAAEGLAIMRGGRSMAIANGFSNSVANQAAASRIDGVRNINGKRTDVIETQLSSNGQCPQGAGHSDGCLNAQSGGSVQHKDYFTGYTGVHYPTRPAWNVAGVDYPVGHAGALADPSVEGNLPACAKYSSRVVTINVDMQPCVLDHLDFSLYGGMCLHLTGAGNQTVTFTNDKFFPNISSCPYSMISVDRKQALNIKMQYSDIADERSSPMTSDISWYGIGTITLQYNNFHNISCRIVNTGEGSTASVVLEYNYLESIGTTGECHGETVEYNSANVVALHVESFNNYYQPEVGCTVAGGCDTAFAYITSGAPGPQGPGAMTSATVNNNVMITRFSKGGNVSIAGPIWVDTTFNNTIESVTVNNNYIDPTGSYFTILVHAGGDFPGQIGKSTCIGNKRLSSYGTTAITGLLGKGASTMQCE